MLDHYNYRLSGQRDAGSHPVKRSNYRFEETAQGRAAERDCSHSRPQRSGQTGRLRSTSTGGLDSASITDHLSIRLKCAVSSVVEHYLDTVGVRGSKPLPRTIFTRHAQLI